MASWYIRSQSLWELFRRCKCGVKGKKMMIINNKQLNSLSVKNDILNNLNRLSCHKFGELFYGYWLTAVGYSLEELVVNKSNLFFSVLVFFGGIKHSLTINKIINLSNCKTIDKKISELAYSLTWKNLLQQIPLLVSFIIL